MRDYDEMMSAEEPEEEAETRHPLETSPGVFEPPEGHAFIGCPDCDGSDWICVVNKESTSMILGLTLSCSDCGYVIDPTQPYAQYDDEGDSFWPEYDAPRN